MKKTQQNKQADKLVEIASAWGTSRAYVYKMAKKGCPIDSIEAAKEWRSANVKRAGMWSRPLETKTVKNEEPIAFAVTGAVVFNKTLKGMDRLDMSTTIEVQSDGVDSWLRITQDEGSIELNFNEWPVLQAAVELIIKTRAPKLD
jgi:hypothetical protein